MLPDGLYEQIINEGLNKELSKTDRKIEKADLDLEEAPAVLSQYIAGIVKEDLENLKDKKKDLNLQVDYINRLVNSLSENSINQLPKDKTEQLLGIVSSVNNIAALDNKTKLIRPETSIAQSSLFTGSIHEPQMVSELKKEIPSCNKIDLLVSFIKWSGLRLIINELLEFTQNGGKLRIITTSYMGATETKAIIELSKLPNTEIKINYNSNSTKHHAKAYIFNRNTGYTTAYIGSSNLSHSALTNGLEWNFKATNKDLPETINKINATFESYWNSKEFELYDESQKDKLDKALKAEKNYGSHSGFASVDVNPYPFQQEILDQIEAERKVRGFNKNLIVAATGTGKTVISALDYKRFRKENPDQPCRLLFVAHREEILTQSLNTFRIVLNDPNFGDLFVGTHRPESLDNLFISVQTFNSQDFTSKTSSDFYDFIIIDEFHHAAAPTYQKLLSYYNPKILVGLTATPERMDGKNIFKYFNDRIAAEIRLPEAINRDLLSPFQYFGVTDTVDLSQLKWTRGGYDKNELTNIYSIDRVNADRRASHIIERINYYVNDIDEVKGLGFCVSIEHARYMAEFFNSHGISSIALTGNSSTEERNKAKELLTKGEVKFIFVVDLYNEGVDIPEINTVLFLRPTESLTIFLQQLGRGLRKSDDKDCLTVLDFIGQANKNYRFEEKFRALLTNTTTSLEREIKNGFKSLPKGCFIELEQKATDYVLENIKASFNNRRGIKNKIVIYEEETGKEANLTGFLDYFNLSPFVIYNIDSFSQLVAEAHNKKFEEPLALEFKKALLRFAYIDSRRWIKFLLEILPEISEKDFTSLNSEEKRMFQMFYNTLFNESIDDFKGEGLKKNLKALDESPKLKAELLELLKFNLNKIDFIDKPVDVGFNCPLDLYCTYTRNQILLAFDFMNPSNVREGVKWTGQKTRVTPDAFA